MNAAKKTARSQFRKKEIVTTGRDLCRILFRGLQAGWSSSVTNAFGSARVTQPFGQLFAQPFARDTKIRNKLGVLLFSRGRIRRPQQR